MSGSGSSNSTEDSEIVLGIAPAGVREVLAAGEEVFGTHGARGDEGCGYPEQEAREPEGRAHRVHGAERHLAGCI